MIKWVLSYSTWSIHKDSAGSSGTSVIDLAGPQTEMTTNGADARGFDSGVRSGQLSPGNDYYNSAGLPFIPFVGEGRRLDD